MGRVTGFIVRLSPYGVFFIAASAAGTMDLVELARIQGYLVILTVLSLAICFVVMPSIISSMTPFKQRDVAPLLRAAFILAFATGKTLIVLPLLIEGIREIFDKHKLADEESTSTIDILVPLAYSFPHLGRIIATAFIPFAAWYVGSPLTAEQYPVLLGASTFFSLFDVASVHPISVGPDAPAE
jgi:Na+/H+-dicarboxylate symporter